MNNCVDCPFAGHCTDGWDSGVCSVRIEIKENYDLSRTTGNDAGSDSSGCTEL